MSEQTLTQFTLRNFTFASSRYGVGDPLRATCKCEIKLNFIVTFVIISYVRVNSDTVYCVEPTYKTRKNVYELETYLVTSNYRSPCEPDSPCKPDSLSKSEYSCKPDFPCKCDSFVSLRSN